jgi:hypothetical protein
LQIPSRRSEILAGDNRVIFTDTGLNMFWAVWLSHVCCYGGHWRGGKGVGVFVDYTTISIFSLQSRWGVVYALTVDSAKNAWPKSC